MSLLEIKNLTVEFKTGSGAFRAVEGVSLNGDTGEVLAIVGESGSGKSTVGRLVADSLGWEFVDSDRLIEEREGRPIPEIMGPNREHEAHFRSLESAALASLAGRQSVVIATGGGPGLMEAANRGAADAGAPSIGFKLPLIHI